MPFSELRKTIPLPDKQPFSQQPITIGDHFKYQRLQRGLLIKDVIEALQIDRETLRGWENGLYKPFPKHFPKIIEFLGYYPFEQETSTLGGRIKKHRLSLGLNQEQFAKLINVERCSIMYWENNTRIPNENSLRKLKKVLKEM